MFPGLFFYHYSVRNVSAGLMRAALAVCDKIVRGLILP